jgi:hypothetical protein
MRSACNIASVSPAVYRHERSRERIGSLCCCFFPSRSTFAEPPPTKRGPCGSSCVVWSVALFSAPARDKQEDYTGPLIPPICLVNSHLLASHTLARTRFEKTKPQKKEQTFRPVRLHLSITPVDANGSQSFVRCNVSSEKQRSNTRRISSRSPLPHVSARANLTRHVVPHTNTVGKSPLSNLPIVHVKRHDIQTTQDFTHRAYCRQSHIYRRCC